MRVGSASSTQLSFSTSANMIVDLTKPEAVGRVPINLTDVTRSEYEAILEAQARNRAVQCAKDAARAAKQAVHDVNLTITTMRPLPSQPIQWTQDDSEAEDDSETESDEAEDDSETESDEAEDDSETESDDESDDEPEASSPKKRPRLQEPPAKRPRTARRTPEECWAQFGLSTDNVYVAIVGGMNPRKHACRVRMNDGVLQWRKEKLADRWMGQGTSFSQHEPQDLSWANVPLKSDIFVLRKNGMYVQCQNVISLNITRVQHT